MEKEMTEQAQDQVDSRTALLNAAAELFAQQGYSATGVQQITDAAGVNKAMLYYYFVSKDGLYDALVGEGIRAVEHAVEVAEACEGPIGERLERFIVAYIAVVVDHPEMARIIFREVMGGGERARQTVVTHMSESLRRLETLCAKAQEAGELRAMDPTMQAYSLFGMATMFISSHFVVGRALDPQAIATHIVEIFLHGAAQLRVS